MLAAVDVADMLVSGACRSASRTASSRGWSGPRSTRPRRCRTSRSRSSRQHSAVLDDDFYAVLSQGRVAGVEGERGRDVAGPRVREQLAHARAELDSDGPAPPDFYARPVLEAAPALLGCVVAHGDARRRDRRDRGLPLQASPPATPTSG